MKKILLATLFLISLFSFSQGNDLFSPQEKAYMFHTVRKSPILEKNIGRYLEYTGKAVNLPSGKPNYDSIELIIINNPEQLFIRSLEIAKSPKGILAELSNKMALWELNKLLQSKRSNDLEKDNLVTKYAQFESELMAHLPNNALKVKNDKNAPHPKLDNLINPSLTFDNKVALLNGMKFLSLEEKKQTADALNKAVNFWVKERAFAIFLSLGGKADYFINILTAAGDGSTTSGLFEEREKDERGRYNRGLPKAVGLFPYESSILTTQEKKKKRKREIQPSRYTISDIETAGNGKETNIHVDVWGYNSEKQTTVVIEKKGVSYPLFGSTESRFLSPDSSYTGKATYYSIIHLVEKDIADLNEMIYGKKGFDYWIDYYTDKKQDKLYDIEKLEKLLSDMRMGAIVTDKNGLAKGANKKTKYRKEELIREYERLATLKRKIKELEEEKEIAIDMLSQKNQKLNSMQNLIGRNWMPFKLKDGLYLFEDSTRFDMYTQEFTFPASAEKEMVEVRLLAIPYSQNSNEADEVMLHINVTDALPKYDARLHLKLNDVFASDDFTLENKLFNVEDSVAILEFFEALTNKKIDFNVIARGQGIGKWNGSRTVKNSEPEELNKYPTDTRESEEYKRLRLSEVIVDINRVINLEVNSYTDPVKSNLTKIPVSINTKMSNYRLTKNEVLSALRTYTILEQMRKELNVLAGKYLERSEAKKVIDRLNKKISKTKISVGRTSFKMSEFKN